MTVVQQHCSYWDKDGDGVIWPQDTWRGVRAWGWNWFLSALATFIINVNLSYPTVPSFLPDPFFPHLDQADPQVQAWERQHELRC